MNSDTLVFKWKPDRIKLQKLMRNNSSSIGRTNDLKSQTSLKSIQINYVKALNSQLPHRSRSRSMTLSLSQFDMKSEARKISHQPSIPT